MAYPRFARVVFSVAVAGVLAGVLAGCAGGPEPGDGGAPDTTAAGWFEACPAASAGSPRAADPRDGSAGSPDGAGSPGAGSADGAGGGSADAMPEVALPCIRPGDGTDFGEPRGVPTVVNVWASWCQPCREELPEFQSYADRGDGGVQVLGVVSGDTRTAAVALAKDLDVRFPTLFDEKATLIRSLGRTALPVTLFVDADGRLVHLYNGQPLTERSLSGLVKRHLGVGAS